MCRAGPPGAAGASLGLIALARRGAADDRARRRGGRRAGGAGAGAVLLGVADVARARVADRARVAGGVLAVIVGPVALIERAGVAVVGARREGRRLRIRRAGRARHAGAELLHVARAGRGAADGRARRRQGRRAGGARPGAVLRRITVVPRAGVPARGRVAGGVLAGIAQPVARIERAGVAVVGARRAGRLLPVGRAMRARAGAELRRVALVHRRPTRGGRGFEGVGGAVVAAPVAGRGDVAGAGRRAALGARGLLRIRGALRARPRAGLGHVAGPGRGPALRPGVPRRVLAAVGAPVALVERAGVTVVGAGCSARLLRIRRARGARARAVLRQVARARRRATDRARRQEGVGRARIARPVTGL